MTQTAFEGDSESRTQSTGQKRSLTNNPSKSRKRRRNNEHQASFQIENSFSIPEQHVDNYHLSDEESAQDLDTVKTSEMNYGRNRLATGFVRHTANTEKHKSKNSAEITDALISDSPSPDDSPVDATEISDDEADGGIVINLDNRHSSEEMGEIVSPSRNDTKSANETPDLFVVDPVPSTSLKRLADLNAQELDSQIKYAFFHLDRHQIDLNRPTLCLLCLDEGHLQADCKSNEVHTGLFPTYRPHPEKSLELWISCCVCASKLHLVGDCPRVQSDKAVRWSLKALDSQQIINRSLQSGIDGSERAAENRNMRPAGLQIKGRAGMHHAGVGPPNAQDSSDDEPFLRGSVRAGKDDRHNGSQESHRYDRYDGPTNSRPYRGGGKWYATDTFGRRRSRSPDDHLDTYRPQKRFDDSYGSARQENWRPGPDRRRERNHPRPPSPSRNGRPPTAKSNSSGPNIQISLPSRKGSNTWAQTNEYGGSSSASNNRMGGSSQAKKRRKPSKKT